MARPLKVAVRPPHEAAFMVQEHQRLAHWMVHRFCTAYPHLRDLREELLGPALERLYRAAQLWEPDRGTKFSTYAVPTLYRGLCRAAANARGRPPLTPPTQLQRAVPLSTTDWLPFQEATAAALQERPGPERLAEHRELIRLVLAQRDRAVDLHVRRDWEIAIRRASGETLDEIGGDHDLSRERVRQIYLRMLPRLRAVAGVGG